MKNIYPLLLGLTLFLLSSCEELFEYHPNQIILQDDERDLTARNLAKLESQQPGDTLHLLLMGDTQRFYDAASAFVDKANTFPHIDFVIHQGDISDFGLSQEFKWVHNIMKGLKWPYLTVVGNHDMLANGRKVYRQMYGDFNYSFVYGHTKFVMIDTNGREYGFNGKVPDLDWLSKELTRQPGDTWHQAIVVSHMPPYDGDFDTSLELPFHETLKESDRVQLSLHGHIHNWRTEETYDNTILYHATTTVKKRGFTYLKVWRGGFEIERIAY
ncbi:metallophosphoesterase [Pontibacter sp. JH31]|uniref:Metallophosphoesterase n=1 Tax=Pontibacter aquaedesilientis TaxID=2766980 RepID=A0ABR7XL72_9BACT|nr:metallophosphoesterase [Pontibacter aquaedesilientis]MBD1398993.1 metallophosphoesterase [Pontibacter aquaedesilientis]